MLNLVFGTSFLTGKCVGAWRRAIALLIALFPFSLAASSGTPASCSEASGPFAVSPMRLAAAAFENTVGKTCSLKEPGKRKHCSPYRGETPLRTSSFRRRRGGGCNTRHRTHRMNFLQLLLNRARLSKNCAGRDRSHKGAWERHIPCPVSFWEASVCTVSQHCSLLCLTRDRSAMSLPGDMAAICRKGRKSLRTDFRAHCNQLKAQARLTSLQAFAWTRFHDVCMNKAS